MGERCRCGAELLPALHFCVGCGAERAGAGYPVSRGRTVAAAPVRMPVPARHTSVPVPRQAPAPRATAPRATAPHAPAPRAAALHAPAPHAPAPRATAPRATATWTPAPRPVPPPWPTPPAPVTRAPRSLSPWLVALSVVLVVVVSAGAVLVALRPALVFGEPVAAAAPAAVAPPVAPAVVTPTVQQVTVSDKLRDQVDLDRSRVEAVTGWWVPQLSSKRSGTVDGGVAYDEDRILSHYRGLAAQYPGAALLWSGEWPVFREGDYWVVVVAQPFSTAAQANAWCEQQGFGGDDCLAKKLSHSGGPAGTTVHR